jgi:hypothetical protein
LQLLAQNTMAISSSNALNEIAAGLAVGADRLVIDKASLSNMTAGTLCSLWRATGQPGQAAIPTSAAVPTKATTGAFAFVNQTDPVTSYLAWLVAACSNSAMGLEFHDRIAHYGGLVLNSTSAQNLTGMDLSTLAPPSERLGDSNYSDVQWFLETYTDGGATASNATINVTYNDATTGNLNVLAVGGTLRAGRLLPLTPLIPTGSQGKFIRGINSVTLSASTGTAGNFGFTCLRQRTSLVLAIANKQETGDWASLGLPNIPNDSCMQMVLLTSTTSTGTVRGQGKIIHV